MIVSITKLELSSYSKFKAFIGFNRKIITELQRSKCKAFKVSPNWSFRTWYTITLWETEADLLAFYRNGTHAKAMQEAANFSTNLKAIRIEGTELLNWRKAKKLIN